MVQKAAGRLIFLCDSIPAQLQKIDENQFLEKPFPDKWSKKEILGHLIDSAANNHQRFVRVQFATEPEIWYDQNAWNQFSYHQAMESPGLIQFWEIYNRHLAELIRNIPNELLHRICIMRDGSSVTLAFLINDYVDHMEHHLNQILSHDKFYSTEGQVFTAKVGRAIVNLPISRPALLQLTFQFHISESVALHPVLKLIYI